MNKPSLFVASRWNEKDLKSTWAGTSYSLYNALTKYFNTDRIQYDPQDKLFRLLSILSARIVLFARFKYAYVEYCLRRRVNSSVPIIMFPGMCKVESTYCMYRDNSYATFDLYDLIKEQNSWPFVNIDYILPEKNKEYLIKREYEVYKDAKAIFFMGNWLANYMKEKYPDLANKIYAVGGGSNVKVRRSNVKRTGTKILFVGKDFYRKGGDLVVASFLLLKKRKKDLQLIIAGPKNNPIKDDIEDLFFLGEVSFERVAELMSEADVFCMPSRFEAYGLVFVEALCSGLPCVARNAWEMPYFIKEGVTGELINSDDPQELSDKLEIVLGNSHYLDEVLKRKNEYMSYYNWDRVARVIYEVLNK